MEGTALCKSLCMSYLAHSSKSVPKSLSVSDGRSYSRVIVLSTLSVSSGLSTGIISFSKKANDTLSAKILAFTSPTLAWSISAANGELG
eukprot:12439531-Ditylum_brightwellii.AAC.1